ncbi:MAG: hypothetical protein WDZ76_10365 [Pseudohongiellaceae bacterium]
MRSVFAALASILILPIAAAQSLTTEQASNFIESLDEVNTYAESLDPAVRTGALDEEFMPERGQPFAPYSRAADYLRGEHDAVYDDMDNIVADHGFSSLELWAETGDRVAVAYMALEMEETDMQQITPEMLDQVPPQMREQMERALAVFETIRDAPPEDVEVLRPLASRLGEYMGGEPPQ